MTAENQGGYARPDDWKSIDLIYDLALRELDFQIKAWEEADGRLRLLLGFIGIIFAGALGVTGSLSARVWTVRLFAGLAVVALVISAVLASVAYQPRGLHHPPSIGELRVTFLTRATIETKLAVVDQLLAVYDLNRAVIAQKLAVYRRAQWLLAASVTLLAFAILARLVTRQ